MKQQNSSTTTSLLLRVLRKKCAKEKTEDIPVKKQPVHRQRPLLSVDFLPKRLVTCHCDPPAAAQAVGIRPAEVASIDRLRIAEKLTMTRWDLAWPLHWVNEKRPELLRSREVHERLTAMLSKGHEDVDWAGFAREISEALGFSRRQLRIEGVFVT